MRKTFPLDHERKNTNRQLEATKARCGGTQKRRNKIRHYLMTHAKGMVRKKDGNRLGLRHRRALEDRIAREQHFGIFDLLEMGYEALE